MALALLSSRKSKSACDIPFTEWRTWSRMNAISETSVPICGEYPCLGPTMVRPESSAAPYETGRASPETVAVKSAPANRKVLREGAQSEGNMAFSTIDKDEVMSCGAYCSERGEARPASAASGAEDW